MPRAKTILSWDTVNWSIALRRWEPHVSFGSLDCLELGCGPGGVSLWLASKGHHVLCTDAREPGADVKELHRRHGVANLVEYQAVDAMAMPFIASYDIIVVKSVFGEILSHYKEAGLHRAVSEIHKALKPDGKLLFAENLRGSAFHMYCRRKFLKRVEGVWTYPTLEEMLGYLSPFATMEFQTAGFLGAFGRQEWQRTLLAYADKALVPMLPMESRYILAGVAGKSWPR